MATFKAIVVEKSTALMMAAFGLIAALAWNDAIKSLFLPGGYLYAVAKYGPWVYAILVTAIAIIAIIWLSKVAEKAK